MKAPWRLLLLLLACSPFTVIYTLSLHDALPISLFDGTDLSSWEYGKDSLHRKTETPDGRLTENACKIELTKTDKSGNKDVKKLVTVKKFLKDFDFKFEFKAANEAEGTVTVRNLE